MLVDSHCHLDSERYDADRGDVIARAREAGVVAIINPAVDLKNSALVCDLAGAEPLVFAAVGVHPNSTADFAPSQLAALRALAGREKVVAIGEIGLDYYRDWSPPDRQRRALVAHLGLAAELGLPVIIHNREATDDLLKALADWVSGLGEPLRDRPGVLHSWSAPPEAADWALDLGFFIGFTGPVTFKGAKELRRIAADVPADRLLVETDGPFLTPHPHRGQRNEPAYVRVVADAIAAVRGVSVDDIARQTTVNARRLFNLPLDVPA